MQVPSKLHAIAHPQLSFQNTLAMQTVRGAQEQGNLTKRGITKNLVLMVLRLGQNSTELREPGHQSIRLLGVLKHRAFDAHDESNMIKDVAR